MKNFNLIFLFVLGFIGFITHAEWFNLQSILSAGDWSYLTNETFINVIGLPTWFSATGLGIPNVQLYFNVFQLPWSFLINVGFNYDFVSKLNLFIPIAILGFISPYLLSKKLINNSFIAFVSALFYGSTSYFLVSQTSHIPITFAYGIAPLVILFFMITLEKNRVFYWLLFSVVYSVAIAYELRIGLIITFVLFLYFLSHYIKEWKKFIKNVLISVASVFLLSSFWIIPSLFGNIDSTVGELTGRGLFGSQLVNIARAFSLSHWAWTGEIPNGDFDPQPILQYLWIVPFLIFFPFSVKKQFDKKMFFFLALALIGLLLTKQAAPPFSGLYSFLYDFLPGFNLFRESSKFYLLISIGYLGLISYSLKFFSENLKNKGMLFVVFCSLIIVSFLNLKPMFTKEIGGVLIDRKVPEEYLIINKNLRDDKNFYRTLSVPAPSQWIFFSPEKPRLSMVNLSGKIWKEFVNEKKTNPASSSGQLMSTVWQNPDFENLLNVSSIRYIFIIPTYKDENYYRYYGENRNFYIDELNSLPFLKTVDIGQNDTVVYENTGYKPRIYATSMPETIIDNIPYKTVDYRQINPTHYEISLKNASDVYYLNFTDVYNKNWFVYVGNFAWWKIFPGFKTGDLRLQNLNEENHFRNDAGLNSFRINFDEICKNAECNINDNNTYDINLTLFYKPQAYLYLGYIISLLTLLFILSYLGYKGFRYIESKQTSNKKQKS
jgi:hypothetical protein